MDPIKLFEERWQTHRGMRAAFIFWNTLMVIPGALFLTLGVPGAQYFELFGLVQVARVFNRYMQANPHDTFLTRVLIAGIDNAEAINLQLMRDNPVNTIWQLLIGGSMRNTLSLQFHWSVTLIAVLIVVIFSTDALEVQAIFCGFFSLIMTFFHWKTIGGRFTSARFKGTMRFAQWNTPVATLMCVVAGISDIPYSEKLIGIALMVTMWAISTLGAFLVQEN